MSALIVTPDASDRGLLTDALRGLGADVDVAYDFHDAKQRLTLTPPDVLITDLRLAAYNGLHLVLRARAVRPQMKAFVLTRTPDPVLQYEATQLGAELVVKEASGGWIAAIVAAIGPLFAGGGHLAGKPVEGA